MRLLIDVRGPENSIFVDLSRQRDWTSHSCARILSSLNNFLYRSIKNIVIISAELNSQFIHFHWISTIFFRENKESLGLCKAQTVHYLTLFNNIRNSPGTNRTTTLTDSETKTFFHGDRSDQFNTKRSVVAWHNHLNTIVKSD